MQTDTIKELQAKLAQIKLENQQLKADVSAKDELLIQINSKLEEAEKFKTHFISSVTNELINPFTSIIALAQSILSVDKEDWKRIISMIALIHSETFTLELQLKNILNAARLEGGMMFLLPTKSNILHLLDTLKDNFKFELRKRQIELVTSCDAHADRKDKVDFITDSEKVNLILSNLLSNAMKFSQDNTTVKVHAHLGMEELVLTIIDTGIGIPAEDRENIFDRFLKLDNEINSIKPGQGLGLSICKGVADLFKGVIEVKDSSNKGTTIVVRIPEQEEMFDGYSNNTNETFFDVDEVF